MITLCKDKNAVSTALELIESSQYLKGVIKLYFDAYGVDYSFCDFHIQIINDEVKSLILRYNTFLYCVTDECADFSELSAWISGVHGSYVYADRQILAEKLSDDYETCFELMFKNYSNVIKPMYCRVIFEARELKMSAELVCKGQNQDIINEFYLDVSHMVRHEKLSVFGIFCEDKLVSAIGVSKDREYCVINFLATDEYFRGNGYAQRLLNEICNADNREYRLLSSNKNLEFYLKCGFVRQNTCYLITL